MIHHCTPLPSMLLSPGFGSSQGLFRDLAARLIMLTLRADAGGLFFLPPLPRSNPLTRYLLA